MLQPGGGRGRKGTIINCHIPVQRGKVTAVSTLGLSRAALPGAAGAGKFLSFSLHLTFLFFFPLAFPWRGGSQNPPPGRRRTLPRVRPAQDSQISPSRIRAEGPGRRAVCPGPGEPHLEGSGLPRGRVEPHRPLWNSAGAELCLDGAVRGYGQNLGRGRSLPKPPQN